MSRPIVSRDAIMALPEFVAEVTAWRGARFKSVRARISEAPQTGLLIWYSGAAAIQMGVGPVRRVATARRSRRAGGGYRELTPRTADGSIEVVGMFVDTALDVRAVVSAASRAGIYDVTLAAVRRLLSRSCAADIKRVQAEIDAALVVPETVNAAVEARRAALATVRERAVSKFIKNMREGITELGKLNVTEEQVITWFREAQVNAVLAS